MKNFKNVLHETWIKVQDLRLNDTLSQMRYAKSVLARLVAWGLRHLLARAEKKGKPDLNLLFISNMPFRALEKMLGGTLDIPMVEGVLTMVNGHFFKGYAQTIKAYRSKRRFEKTLTSSK